MTKLWILLIVLNTSGLTHTIMSYGPYSSLEACLNATEGQSWTAYQNINAECQEIDTQTNNTEDVNAE